MKVIIAMALKILKGKNRFVFSTSYALTFWGIFISVFALFLVTSVMNGFADDMAKRIIENRGDFKILQKEEQPITNYQNIIHQLKKLPGIHAVGAVCEGDLLLRKEPNIAYTSCRGINLDNHKKILQSVSVLQEKEFNPRVFNQDGIIIGIEIAQNLSVAVGDTVEVISPAGAEMTSIGIIPGYRKMVVCGILITGLPEYDRTLSYIALPNAQKLLNLNNSIHYIEIRSTNPTNYSSTKKVIQSILPMGLEVQHWHDFESSIYIAMRIEKIAMFSVLSLMLLLASFTLTGNSIRIISEKRKEIGVLKAIGMNNSHIMKIFLYSGIFVGLSSIFFATCFSMILIFLQIKYHFLTIPIPGFPFTVLPVHVTLFDTVLIISITLFTTIISIYYPAQKTMKLQTISILREKNKNE